LISGYYSPSSAFNELFVILNSASTGVFTPLASPCFYSIESSLFFSSSSGI